MKELFTTKEFKLATSRELLPCKCMQCGKAFFTPKRNITKSRITGKGTLYCNRKCMSIGFKTERVVTCLCCGKNFKKRNNKCLRSPKHYCSLQCYGKLKTKIATKRYKCKQCGKVFHKVHSQVLTKNPCCSAQCSGRYTSTHKKTVNAQVSKLEKWIAGRLLVLYPKLTFHFNNTDKVKRELDIYIPALSIAFEINGPLHYRPIFGIEHLQKQKRNDRHKRSVCTKNAIKLFVINTSKQRRVVPITSQPYLDKITKTIDQYLNIHPKGCTS